MHRLTINAPSTGSGLGAAGPATAEEATVAQTRDLGTNRGSSSPSIDVIEKGWTVYDALERPLGTSPTSTDPGTARDRWPIGRLRRVRGPADGRPRGRRQRRPPRAGRRSHPAHRGRRPALHRPAPPTNRSGPAPNRARPAPPSRRRPEPPVADGSNDADGPSHRRRARRSGARCGPRSGTRAGSTAGGRTSA